ncbi:MAG: hypothetical protein ABEJ70_04710 [Halobacteriaceae archaeon]
MESSTETEACGRCAMTSVTAATADGEYDPFEGGHIEVADSDLRTASAPVVALGRVKRRLDELATRLTYGSR